MKKQKKTDSLILLDFGSFSLPAKLFDTRIVRDLLKLLPVSIELIGWGDELYGSIGVDLGTENPVDKVAGGGLAYTNRGNYFCIFFGQTPAWPVEHIGVIDGERWTCLRGAAVNSVVIYSQPIQFITQSPKGGATFSRDEEMPKKTAKEQ